MYFMRRLHIHCRNRRGVTVETSRFDGGSYSGGVASARPRQMWPDMIASRACLAGSHQAGGTAPKNPGRLLPKKKTAKRKARGHSFEHEGRSRVPDLLTP
jgi:hypothetical protein